jgi:hypothetical protein
MKLGMYVMPTEPISAVYFVKSLSSVIPTLKTSDIEYF